MADLKKRIARVSKQRKIILRCHLSPGDIMMMTAAVRDLKLSHKDILVDVRTSCGEVWENNPHLAPLDEEDPGVEIHTLGYPLIHNSNMGQYHFIHGFRKDLEDKLGVTIKPTDFKGDIHISDVEKTWTSQVKEQGVENKFWIMMAGGKYDFTSKWWNPKCYQEVVDYFKGRITFVQCGQKDHWHPELKGVVNMVGKTALRQFIRLVYHSVGVLSPVTLAMHLAAAVETKHCPPRNRACVVISGGREPVQWEAYPHHRFLAVNGSIDCCDNGGCWKSRCQKVGDGDEKDEKNLCEHPVMINRDLVIPKCMDMIKSEDVIRAIQLYYEGGMLKYD